MFRCVFGSVVLHLVGVVSKDLEADRMRCIRGNEFEAARKPFDMNDTLGPIVTGEKWAELSPKVMSTDPWVVYFENFMTEEEVLAIEAHLFNKKKEFMPSPAGGAKGSHQARHSETAFCIGDCDAHATIQSVRKRAGSIVKVPPENFDLSQALRYKEGMYYKEHHDNHPTFHYLPSGARIYTYFVYLSDEGLEGGATYFPQLKITAPAKRGAAVLFADTKDRNPMETDYRTTHESLPVIKGEKRGMNMWLYQYNYRDFWGKHCTSIELADQLGAYGKATVNKQPQVTFNSNVKKDLHIFSTADRRPERYVDMVKAGENLTVQGVEGEVFQVRNARKGGKNVAEHSVRGSKIQNVKLGKKKEEKAEL